MSQNQLQEFFHNKKEKAKPVDIDWEAKRDGWIKAVNDLYTTIEDDFLEAAKEDVQIDHQEKVVKENNIGEYTIKELILRVGDEQVIFSPKGTNIVGAKGRIDVEGDRGSATIVWENDKDWKIVASRVPALQLIKLDADSLAELLRRVMRP